MATSITPSKTKEVTAASPPNIQDSTKLELTAIPVSSPTATIRDGSSDAGNDGKAADLEERYDSGSDASEHSHRHSQARLHRGTFTAGRTTQPRLREGSIRKTPMRLVYKGFKVESGRVIPRADGAWMCELTIKKVLLVDDLTGELREVAEGLKRDVICCIARLQE